MKLIHRMRIINIIPSVAWGVQNSANVCPCACRKRRLIMGYKLSYTTGNYCMLGLLACSEVYEFGELGTGLSWFR